MNTIHAVDYQRSLNEMISNPGLYPAWTRIPHSQTPAQVGPEPLSKRIPNPMEEFYGCRILGVKTVGGTIEAEMSSVMTSR
jgi:hypothetical protein